MSRPFEGIRVIDITHVLAGPHATYQLALLGADVIKVERPGDPDQSREQGPDVEANKQWMGTGFLSQGSNKRSITLDLKTPQGQEILKKLVKDADVLVENYRSGALRDLGLGYEDLIKIKPDLVYCSMTAWGQDGPRGSQTAYDQVIQGYSGVMSITGTEAAARCGAARRCWISAAASPARLRLPVRSLIANAPAKANILICASPIPPLL